MSNRCSVPIYVLIYMPKKVVHQPRGRTSTRAGSPLVPALTALLVIVCAALLAAPELPADSTISTQLDIFQSVIRTSADDLGLATSGRARLDIQSRGNTFVRGRFTLDAFLSASDSAAGPAASLNIHRAFIKTRFPLSEERFFNITAGKTRLTWGDGALFNAGDIIFGRSARNPDLTQSTIRDETAWMLVAFVPLDDFAFVEDAYPAAGA